MAGNRAAPASFQLIFRAFIAAGLANRGTENADLSGKLRFAGHFASCQKTSIGTTPRQFDAANQDLELLVMKAGGHTGFAGGRADITSVDAFEIFHGGMRVEGFRR